MSLSKCKDNGVNKSIHDLASKALNSRAVTHHYLLQFANGSAGYPKGMVRDFALQYGFYSANFIAYVSSVIENLDDQLHREILQENLDEERGNVHGVDLPPDVLETVIGQPHSSLFQRFQQAAGVSASSKRNVSNADPGAAWARDFQKLCSKNVLVGIGALGLGTELIVSSIYSKILSGIKSATDIAPKDYVFFELHSECDDDHAQQLLLIASQLAIDSDAERQIEYGMSRALELRCRFWDQMLERSEAFRFRKISA